MGKQKRSRGEGSSRSASSDQNSKPQASTKSKEIRSTKKRTKKRKMSQNHMNSYIHRKQCEICMSRDNEGELLLCDRCDDSYHRFCMVPPIKQIPQIWTCPPCVLQTVGLQISKEQQMKAQRELQCFVCKKDIDKKQFIKGLDQQGNIIQIQLKDQIKLTCAYCRHSFHNVCFSERKNSLNCQSCQKILRRNGPKSHDEFMRYIETSIQTVRHSDYFMLEHGQSAVGQKRHRCFRLKVPTYMTSWQFIVQNQASLYYAFATKKLTFIDDQIYHGQDRQTLMKLNSPQKQTIMMLHEKDQRVYQEFKINSKKGYVGPFQVKEDRAKGFYLVATDFIQPFTIVSQYSGEVMTSRQALNYEENDSIFMLVKRHRTQDSLDIVPQKYGNISRFFSGINNSFKRSSWTKLQNIRSLKFSYRGRVHLLLHTTKPIQAGETLYFDYNGDTYFHEYPTDHFVQ